jgi:hypothetical protein
VFLHAESDHGIFPVRFLSVAEKRTLNSGVELSLLAHPEPFPASERTKPLAGPTACGAGKD